MSNNNIKLKMTPGKLMMISLVLCAVSTTVGYYTCADKELFFPKFENGEIKYQMSTCKSYKIAMGINLVLCLFVLYRLFTLRCF